MHKSRILRNTFYIQLGVFVAISLTQTVGSLVDGVIIGQFLGVDSIAAFGIISPLLTAFSLFGAIISSGARNRFTRLVGAGKIEEAQKMFSLSFILSVGVSTVAMFLILPFAKPFTVFLGASGNAAGLLPKASGYLIGITVGLPAMNAVRTLNAYMPIDNDANLPIIASIVLTVVDILLDLGVVLVIHGDTFEMGLATSLSYYASALVLFLHFRKKKRILKFSLRGIAWGETGGILVQGMPKGICRVANTMRSTYMNRLLAVIATTSAIAAYSVHRQADSFLNPVTIGMGETIAMLTGILMGEEDKGRIKQLLHEGVRGTLIVTTSVAVITWFLAPLFAALFIKDDPEALAFSIRAVRAYAVGMPLYGLNMNYTNYMQGLGMSRLSSIGGFLMECGFLVVLARALSVPFGADGIWYAFPVTQLLMLPFYLLAVDFFRRRSWISTNNFRELYLMLPDHFDVPPEDEIDRTVHSMEEVTQLSHDVWEFCEKHGCDPRRKYLMSLSVEEMAGNVVLYGIKENRGRSIDVRVIKKGDDYILRIRDDCLIFDPVNQLTVYTNEDPTHHMGIRMIIQSAQDVHYTCVLKLNNLVVKV